MSPIAPVKDPVVWKHVKTMYMGAALLFLINIFIGFDNVLVAPGLPRAQLLTHLHAGSIGWITLSVIATTVWAFTGQRKVSAAYAGRIGLLGKVAIGAFFGYIIAFATGFSLGLDYKVAYILLPIFGSSSALIIWIAAGFAYSQLKHQEVVTATHLLLTGALTVAALGALMGVLLGLEYTAGFFIPGDRIGAHAGMMDTYLFLAASAIIGWWSAPESDRRWTKGAMVQAGAWTVGGAIALVALLVFPPLMMGALLLLVVGLVTFVIRVGWRMLLRNPFEDGQAPIWLANMFMIFYVTAFIVVIFMYAPKQFVGIPRWTFIVLAHGLFIGTMTNVFLALVGMNRSHSPDLAPGLFLGAIWVMTAGLLAFAAGEILADDAKSAALMGIGVLTAVVILLMRLAHARHAGATGARPEVPLAAHD